MSDLMNNALEKMENISENDVSSEIESFSEIIRKISLETLINQNLFDILPEELENQLINVRSNLDASKDENVKILSSYFKIIKIFADKFIKNKNIACLYPVSVIFYYLQINPQFLSQILNEKAFLKINNAVYEFFCKIDGKFIIPESAPDYEKIYFEKYQTGLKENDIENVYIFIDGIERGRNIYPNIFIVFLANLLLLNPKKYFMFLESLKDLYTLVKYINIIENKINEEFMDLIMTSKNIWMIFEYLIQIFKNLNDQNKLEKKEILSISLMFKRLYTIDEEFFINGTILLIKKNFDKKYLGICIGKSLSNINEKELLKKIIEHIGIDEYHYNLQFIDYVMITIAKENNALLEFMGSFVFDKWDKFLKNRFKSEKLIIMPIYTDYFGIVIWYFQKCLSNNRSKFLELLDKRLDEIIYYKSHWVKYPSRKRFISLSYVYAMSISWRKVNGYKLKVKRLEEKLNYIINDKRMYIMLSTPNYDVKDYILKIKENFKI